MKIPAMDTPKSLDEAIRRAICIGTLSGLEERVRAHVRDYLAQQFGVAYLTATGEELGRLMQLWERITGEPPRPHKEGT